MSAGTHRHFPSVSLARACERDFLGGAHLCPPRPSGSPQGADLERLLTIGKAAPLLGFRDPRTAGRLVALGGPLMSEGAAISAEVLRAP